MPHAHRSRPLALSLVLGALVFSCRTSTSVAPAGLEGHQIRQGVPHRAWLVLDGEGILGTVVRFGDPRWPRDPGRHFYSVRNPWHQEVGHVDAFGRAWRFVPHESEPAWLCTTTLLEGVRRVLEAPESARLHEVPPESLSPRSRAAPQVPARGPGMAGALNPTPLAPEKPW